MHFSEEKSRIHFEMLEPRLLDRMGLIKFDFDIVNERVLQELQSKLDIKTNRLTAGIQGWKLHLTAAAENRRQTPYLWSI